MSPGWSAVVYLGILVSALASAQAGQSDPRQEQRRPVATAVALLVVGVPTALQLTIAPWLLGDLGRDWAKIGDGQVWRLVTALVVQDGGVAGAVFNLTFLAVIGMTAETAWGARRWALIALTAGIGAELWGGVVQPVGAGNSVVVFGLAASLAVLAVRREDLAARSLGALSLLGAVVLLVVGDLHGGASAIGAAVAVMLLRRVSRGASGSARRPWRGADC